MLIATRIPMTTMKLCARFRAFLLNMFIVYSSYTMVRNQTTMHQRPFYHSWFFLVPLALVFSLFVRSAYASFVKKQHADIERERYEEQLSDLERKKADLQAKIEHLETDRGLEDELRTRFDVVREGETVIRIIEEE